MKKNEVAIVFGKFNGPHIGHIALIDHMRNYAKEQGIDHRIYTGTSHFKNAKAKKPKVNAKTPLDPETKVKHMKRVFNTENIHVHSNPFGAVEDLLNSGHSRVHIVLGSDRIDDDTAQKLKNQYGDRVAIVAGPQRIDDPTNRVASASSTRLRSHATKNDFKGFRNLLPEHMSEEHAQEYFNDMREGLRKAGESLHEEVSVQTRIKLSRAAKRTAPRRKIVRAMRAKRRKSMGQLKVRARNEIKDQLRRKVSHGNWKKMSFSARAMIDKRLSRKPIKKLADQMVKRIMPQVLRGESERLKSINDSFNPIVNALIENYITEAMKGDKPKRQPLTGEKKLKRRAQNRNNQSAKRTRDANALSAGDIRGKVLGVEDEDGNFLIISKRSFDERRHRKVVDPERATRGALEKFLNKPQFVNTETSEKLFGFVERGAGKKKEKAAKKEEPKAKSKAKPKAQRSSARAQEETPAPTVVAAKKAAKNDTFPTSHGATEMESGILFAFNAMLGLKPEQMVSMGLIDKKDLDAVLANPHQSYMPSCQRAAQQLLSAFGPGVYLKHTGRLKKSTKLSENAIKEGVVDNTPKSDLVVVDRDGKVIAGLSQKIGDSQLASGGPAETMTNLKWAAASRGDKLKPDTSKKLKQLEKMFREELGGNPRTRMGPVSLYQAGGAREGQEKEVERRERLHEQATELVNDLLNSDEDFAAAFIYSLITGSGKFEQGDPAIASHIFSANRDGTDAKITPVDMNYAKKMVGKIKVQMKFKSSAVETTDVKKKWNDFKAHKKSIGEKVSLEEDFRPYSYRSVIRAYSMTGNVSESFRLTGHRLVKSLLEDVSEKNIQELAPDPTTPEEAMEYLKEAVEYIGDDAFKLMQFFEDDFEFTATEPVIDWTELATNQGTQTNDIYVNGRKFSVPVEVPYNYDEFGNMSSPVSESYLEEKRNYRKEYDNYHSRPEQRKNRSKRVLARRLMMKLGKVRKGDGKDVDHKDGNPKNNGKSNLRVRDKSENRADN
jgi:hypothetical protein